jgi:hypothetical protein
MNTTLLRSGICALLLTAALSATAQAGPVQFIIINNNLPGEGFNDPTPVAPVGGNPGTTLGQQRMIAFEHAAKIWSARLDSNVPISILAQMVPLGPGVLGSAGATGVHRDFPNAPRAGTWYHRALANKLAGVDLNPATPDLVINFSTNFNFYLGLDNNHGNLNDLVTVLLHEIAHGIGFSQFASLTTGALFSGFPDVYNTSLLDLNLGKHWSELTNAERAASATRFGRVVWDGGFVTAGVPNVLSFGSPGVAVSSPVALAGAYQFGTANFGPPVGSPSVSALVVAAEDEIQAAGTSTDGCSPFTNAAAVAGKIALIERGACNFTVKGRNATQAGAVAAIIYNNAANANAGPAAMATDTVDGPLVLIPTVSLTRTDGLAILARLPEGVTINIGVDPTIRAGADAAGRVRVWAPFPIAGGSSISHFDRAASRNLLMEPNISADLTHKVKAPEDLTFELLRDVGWTFPDADADGVVDDEDCSPTSDRRTTIIIDGNDSGVANPLLANGCTRADVIQQLAAAAADHGAFVAGIADLTNTWKAAGIITGAEKGAIQSAAARASIGK